MRERAHWPGSRGRHVRRARCRCRGRGAHRTAPSPRRRYVCRSFLQNGRRSNRPARRSAPVNRGPLLGPAPTRGAYSPPDRRTARLQGDDRFAARRRVSFRSQRCWFRPAEDRSRRRTARLLRWRSRRLGRGRAEPSRRTRRICAPTDSRHCRSCSARQRTPAFARMSPPRDHRKREGTHSDALRHGHACREKHPEAGRIVGVWRLQCNFNDLGVRSFILNGAPF